MNGSCLILQKKHLDDAQNYFGKEHNKFVRS
jgi:hypothetical protein